MAVLHLVKSPCGSYSYRHTIGVLLLCPEWNIFANCATKWGGWIFHKLLCDWGWHSRWIRILQLQRFYSLVTKMPYRNSWKVIDLFHQHGVDRSRPDSCHRDVAISHTATATFHLFVITMSSRLALCPPSAKSWSHLDMKSPDSSVHCRRTI